jgi:hypothetical protein
MEFVCLVCLCVCLFVGWLDLAEDGDQWRALVNTIMKFWVL